MKEMAGRIIAHYERHARDWDIDRNRNIEPWNDKPLLGGIGFEVVAHAVEDWQTGGGRTVWLTRTRAMRTS